MIHAPTGLIADARALRGVGRLREQQAGILRAARADHHPAFAISQCAIFQHVEAQRAGVPGNRRIVVGNQQGGQGDATAHPASAARCSANSSPMPFSASDSSALSSSRRKAWPSAVPCSSMKPPPSFITTFMSVSQSLSSG